MIAFLAIIRTNIESNRRWHIACSVHQNDMHVYDYQRNWYVIYAKPHKEEQAKFYLGLKGVECFFPRLLLPGSSWHKKKIVPLFPNYLFVRIHLSTELHYVVWSPGVKRIVSFGDQ